MKRLVLVMTAVGVLALPALPASAETIALGAELSGKNDIPPNDTTGSGVAELTYDTATKELSWKVTYSGLTGPAIAAHIHGPAPSGGNAGVMIGFADAASPIEGSTTLDESKEKAVLAGHTYVNIHTDAHPGGEIRGLVRRK